MSFAYATAAQAVTDVLALVQPAWPIVWAQQGVDRPEPPFWGVRFGDLSVVGALDVTSQYAFDATQVGRELTRKTQGVRMLHVSLQAYCVAAMGDPDPALAAMAAVAMAVNQPTQVDLLAAVGLGLVDVGAVQNISALLQTDWESRANLDLRFYVVDDAEESVGYIASATPVGTMTQ